jgi:hypothetical protein
MGSSPLTGAERAESLTRGRDSSALGPSDTSDSASDVAGLDYEADPNLPVDIAMQPDAMRPETSHELVGVGVDSDAEGTGERRSAAADAGTEAADISPDRIVRDPNSTRLAREDGSWPQDYSRAFDLRDAPDDDEQREDEPPERDHASPPARRQRHPGGADEKQKDDPTGPTEGRDSGVDDDGDDVVLVPKR